MAAAFVLGEVCAARHLGAGVFLGLFLIAALYIIKNRKKFYKSFLIEVIVLLFCFCFGNFRFYTEEQKCALQEWVTERRQIEFWGRVDWVKETEWHNSIVITSYYTEGRKRPGIICICKRGICCWHLPRRYNMGKRGFKRF